MGLGRAILIPEQPGWAAILNSRAACTHLKGVILFHFYIIRESELLSRTEVRGTNMHADKIRKARVAYLY